MYIDDEGTLYMVVYTLYISYIYAKDETKTSQVTHIIKICPWMNTKTKKKDRETPIRRIHRVRIKMKRNPDHFFKVTTYIVLL